MAIPNDSSHETVKAKCPITRSTALREKEGHKYTCPRINRVCTRVVVVAIVIAIVAVLMVEF